ncbi:MAG: ATP phosphoribosyltransferase regulatory subunit [Desulfobacteraceae bacterium 4572_35.1]|nr:MAG: ATP phosphoribosyltransferase regulatory subunit [Desulfobacteraceae bacterium 4572_35.1]
MNQDNTTFEAMIPKGVKDFLPINAVKIEYLKSTLHQVFKRWGFQPLTPPSLEFLHVLERGLDKELKESTLRFDDRQSGYMLAFPPDITPQIARVFATRMKNAAMPQRLSYSCRVLRHTEQQAGKDREIFQSGIELIGHSGPQADAEMIAIALECLSDLQAPQYTVDIGQVEFYRGVLAGLNLNNTQINNLHNIILHKDSSGLKQQLEKLPITARQCEEIMALPRLFGGVDVLDRAAAVVTNDRSKKALENLHKTLNILDFYGANEHLTIDLGELRGLGYYTGITFQGFLAGFGKAVCLGGRYDDLMGTYGSPAPATGFAFNLLNLLFSMPNQLSKAAKPGADALIVSQHKEETSVHKLASALRSQGLSTCIGEYSPQENQQYAIKMNFRYLITVPETGDTCSVLSISDNILNEVATTALFDGTATL